MRSNILHATVSQCVMPPRHIKKTNERRDFLLTCIFPAWQAEGKNIHRNKKKLRLSIIVGGKGKKKKETKSVIPGFTPRKALHLLLIIPCHQQPFFWCLLYKFYSLRKTSVAYIHHHHSRVT